MTTGAGALQRLLRPRSAPVPRADDGVAARAERLFWAWTVLAGVGAFAGAWLWQRGWLARLVDGDPSGISVAIVLLAVGATVWVGRRLREVAAGARAGSSWRRAYAADCTAAAALAPQLLAERTHGPHETAWWFAAAALKLGLLGTVVGFIVMAAQIGAVASFDLDQVQGLLKQMTAGMAIALYTTLVGLVANLWLGLQLLLLDRLADQVAADILAQAGGGAAAGCAAGGGPAGAGS